MLKILSITEKVPQEATLPNGLYFGTWSGYNIDVHYNGKNYVMHTMETVKGLNIKVAVDIKDGSATFKTFKN